MAVLNPPRVLPGLARSMANFLIESRKEWDEDSLVAAFNPGINDSTDAITNTISAFRAIGIFSTTQEGKIEVAEEVVGDVREFNRAGFRQIMLRQVFDLKRDGDPWAVAKDEANTSGARDLTRALSWFLAQDAMGPSLSWADNVERLQKEQFLTNNQDEWALRNDTRWNAFSRWAPALGLAVPSVVRAQQGLVPLPTIAVLDVVQSMPVKRTPISAFLEAVSEKLPVLPGGTIRRGLVERLGSDPDPGIAAHALDSSLAQVLRILESRRVLQFETLADADGILLESSDQARTTHVTINRKRGQ